MLFLHSFGLMPSVTPPPKRVTADVPPETGDVGPLLEHIEREHLPASRDAWTRIPCGIVRAAFPDAVAAWNVSAAGYSPQFVLTGSPVHPV